MAFPFNPVGVSQRVTVTSSGVRVALGPQTSIAGSSIRIAVRGDADVAVSFGDITTICTMDTGYLILSGSVEAITVSNSAYVFLITDGADTNVHITMGIGE